MRDPIKLIQGSSKWMSDYAEKAHLRAWVVGVSGGIDSTVVERLCENTCLPVVAITMPMWLHENSDPKALPRAIALCASRTNVDFRIRLIGPIWEAYRAAGIAISGPAYSVPDENDVDERIRLSQGNLRSRIRADILRDAAGEVGGCIVGTGNYDEDAIGYFTKGGDGDVDICPLSLMHKDEVYAMANAFDELDSPNDQVLTVPADNLSAIPTAGLWDGQTDEDELGMTYDEIAWAIEHDNMCEGRPNRQLDPPPEGRRSEVLNKVKHMMKINAHKLAFPPVYNPEA